VEVRDPHGVLLSVADSGAFRGLDPARLVPAPS
jgi:hypothetical protein